MQPLSKPTQLARFGVFEADLATGELRKSGACRTPALGGHLEQCTSCAHRSIEYNSCRNRHCPKCQSAARDRWLAARARELLPVAYCHVIFTIVGQLRPLALENQRVFYRLLFRAAAETLLEVAANPRLLGARIGVLAAAHLEPDAPPPSTHSLSGAGRRPLPRRHALDPVQKEVLALPGF